MNERIFNFHEIILVMTALECILLSIYRFSFSSNHKRSNLLIGVFFLIIAVEALTNIIIWNAELSMPSYVQYAIVFCLHLFTQFSRGPIFLAYVHSITTNEYKFSFKQLWHFLPVVIVFIALYLSPISTEQLLFRQSINSPDNRLFADIIWYLMPTTALLYGLSSVSLIKQYKKQLTEHYSDFSLAEVTWLQIITACFIVIWTWAFVVSVVSGVITGPITDKFGTLYNYIVFFCTNALIIYSFHYEQLKQAKAYGSSSEEPVTSVENDEFPQIITKINKAFQQEKIHLEANLTLEQFADKINEPAKLVSHVINHQLNTNFFELVNTQRIEAAKSLLADSSMKHLTVLEIIFMSGFNNKSSFHRFFKRVETQSPTEYRRFCLELQAMEMTSSA